jgi:hypothetical protein
MGKNLILGLAKYGQNGANCFLFLTDKDKLPTLGDEAASDLVIKLAKENQVEPNYFDELFRSNKLPILGDEAASDLVAELVNAKPNGVACIIKLFGASGGKNRLANLRLQDINGSKKVQEKALELLKRNPPDIRRLVGLLV